MFGLSGKIIRGISHGYSTGVLSSLEVVRKVRRWRISRFFRLKPTYSQLADVNTYGYSKTLDDMKKNVSGYAKIVIRKWPGALAKKSWVCRTETRWAVEEALYFRKRIRRHKGKGLWMHEDGQVFAEKGRFKPSFFKPRKRLGFFARRFSRCADSKNVIGFIGDEWDWALSRKSKEYTGGNSCWPMNTKYPTGLNLGLERGDVCREIARRAENRREFISSLSRREAKKNLLQSTWAECYYEERLEVTPEEVYQASVPYIRLIEAYVEINKALRDFLRKRNKKKSVLRLFLRKGSIDHGEELTIDRDTSYASWSHYDKGNRVAVKLQKPSYQRR